jgi:peptide/nickel transport system substrate-binding protein
MLRKKFMSGLALVLAAAFLFTGCGGEKKTAETGDKKEVVKESEEKKENKKPKILVYARGADSTGLDPAYVSDGESSKVIVNVCENLIRYREGTTELEPQLAESWNISEDGLEYIFNLRKDVKFHDGSDFTADDVIWSIDRQLEGKRTADMPYAAFTFEQVKALEKVDDYTVKFVLKEPSTPFLANLAMSLAAPIVKKGDNISENPVGTGPFKFVSWKKDESITLEKFNEYWGEGAKVDKVIFKVTKENSVRASELMTGAVDIIDGISFNDVAQLESSQAVVDKANGMNINYMAFNTDRAPFNDSKLREAIAHAINRDELVEYLYQGYSEVASTYLPSFIPGYADDIELYKYDPEKAKTMLKELGKEDLKLKIITYSNPRPYNPAGSKLAEAIQGYLAKVGVEATIDVYPWKEYKEKALQGEGDLLFFGWIGDNGDADNFLSLLESINAESGLNSAKFANADVDALLQKARTLPNGEERESVYKDVQKLLAIESPWVPLSHATDLVAYQKNIEGYQLHPTGRVYLKDVVKK